MHRCSPCFLRLAKYTISLYSVDGDRIQIAASEILQNVLVATPRKARLRGIAGKPRGGWNLRRFSGAREGALPQTQPPALGPSDARMIIGAFSRRPSRGSGAASP